jgi:hypothetical protein
MDTLYNGRRNTRVQYPVVELHVLWTRCIVADEILCTVSSRGIIDVMDTLCNGMQNTRVQYPVVEL